MTVFTDVGEQQAIDAILANETFYVDWGVGTQAETKAQTDLNDTSPTESRAACTETDNGDNADLEGTITANATRAITEAGLFDAASSGNMWLYDAFSTINVDSGDSIKFTWNIELA